MNSTVRDIAYQAVPFRQFDSVLADARTITGLVHQGIADGAQRLAAETGADLDRCITLIAEAGLARLAAGRPDLFELYLRGIVLVADAEGRYDLGNTPLT